VWIISTNNGILRKQSSFILLLLQDWWRISPQDVQNGNPRLEVSIEFRREQTSMSLHDDLVAGLQARVQTDVKPFQGRFNVDVWDKVVLSFYYWSADEKTTLTTVRTVAVETLQAIVSLPAYEITIPKAVLRDFRAAIDMTTTPSDLISLMTIAVARS
jgi:hypothetical protein